MPNERRSRPRDARGRFVRWTEEDKDDYWKPKARELAKSIPWHILYVDDDGENSYFGSESPDVDDIAPNHNPINVNRVMAIGERIGYDVLTRALREKKYLQLLYWNQEEDRASFRWRHREGGLPGWFWWYHGVNA
jgi:hypothetical protein